MGITENAVRKLESGDSKEPRFSTGLRIADALAVTPYQLCGKVGGKRTGGPELASVVRALREAREPLQERGVEHVSVFGSVARGDATVKSDIDLMIEPTAKRRFSPFDSQK